MIRIKNLTEDEIIEKISDLEIEYDEIADEIHMLNSELDSRRTNNNIVNFNDKITVECSTWTEYNDLVELWESHGAEFIVGSYAHERWGFYGNKCACTIVDGYINTSDIGYYDSKVYKVMTYKEYVGGKNV